MTTTEPTSALEGVLAGADQVMVSVLTRRGPHVTPELFTVAGGRIWCLTAATTLKARLLAGGGPVAVAAATHDGRSAVVGGQALVVDPTHPLRNLRHLGASLASPLAVGQFTARNAAELTGAMLDLLAGKLGRPPPTRRVALCIEPHAAAVLDGDDVVDGYGWEALGDAVGKAEDGTAIEASADADLDVLDGVPEDLRGLAADGPAFLGWTTTSGQPLVLPAEWQSDASRAVVRRGLLTLVGGASKSPACITRDSWTGFGPTGKQGLMLRGGGVASVDGDCEVVALDIDRVAYWDGIETGQVTA